MSDLVFVSVSNEVLTERNSLGVTKTNCYPPHMCAEEAQQLHTHTITYTNIHKSAHKYRYTHRHARMHISMHTQNHTQECTKYKYV